MKKIIMGRYPEINEVEVNIEDVKLKNGKFHVNGEEHAMVVGSDELLEIFYTGVKKALNGEIPEATANEFLKALKVK
ncbi:MAG: hypothetical protein PHC34_02885 [Candidatus Gastranaerophilales bacterium]|nr:hypothetical protein [Candidatus Gastranaerophilales bacterium]